MKTTEFVYQGRNAFLQDDGRGVIKIISSTTDGGFVFLKNDAGTINYDTGEVIISNLIIDSYQGNAIKFIGKTRCGNVFGVKNRIVSIREEDIFITVIGR